MAAAVQAINTVPAPLVVRRSIVVQVQVVTRRSMGPALIRTSTVVPVQIASTRTDQKTGTPRIKVTSGQVRPRLHMGRIKLCPDCAVVFFY
jgi:hypothetical protein